MSVVLEMIGVAGSVVGILEALDALKSAVENLSTPQSDVHARNAWVREIAMLEIELEALRALLQDQDARAMPLPQPAEAGAAQATTMISAGRGSAVFSSGPAARLLTSAEQQTAAAVLPGAEGNEVAVQQAAVPRETGLQELTAGFTEAKQTIDELIARRNSGLLQRLRTSSLGKLLPGQLQHFDRLFRSLASQLHISELQQRRVVVTARIGCTKSKRFWWRYFRDKWQIPLEEAAACYLDATTSINDANDGPMSPSLLADAWSSALIVRDRLTSVQFLSPFRLNYLVAYFGPFECLIENTLEVCTRVSAFRGDPAEMMRELNPAPWYMAATRVNFQCRTGSQIIVRPRRGTVGQFAVHRVAKGRIQRAVDSIIVRDPDTGLCAFDVRADPDSAAGSSTDGKAAAGTVAVSVRLPLVQLLRTRPKYAPFVEDKVWELAEEDEPLYRGA